MPIIFLRLSFPSSCCCCLQFNLVKTEDVINILEARVLTQYDIRLGHVRTNTAVSVLLMVSDWIQNYWLPCHVQPVSRRPRASLGSAGLVFRYSVLCWVKRHTNRSFFSYSRFSQLSCHFTMFLVPFVAAAIEAVYSSYSQRH